MKRLVVVVTGLYGSPRKWKPLLERLQQDAGANHEWIVMHHCGFWNLQATRKWFTKSIDSLALDLKGRIEQQWLAAIAKGEPFDEIICIGHSVGGIILRQAYLVAAGAYPGTSQSNIPWVEKVTRFVLLASINRGFDPTSIFFLLPALVNLSSATGWISILRDTAQGSSFITNLRLSWIRYFAERAGQEPVMIQLLGTEDGVVKRRDSIDIQQFPNGIQLDIPSASHDNLYYPFGLTPQEWDLRYQVLKWAIFTCCPQDTLQQAEQHQGSSAAIPAQLENAVLLAETPTVTEDEIIFIVHGIRDGNSGWARQLEDEIQSQTSGKTAVVRSTYGYFSAFNFFLPWLRRRNLRWFQDEYSYWFALNPQAKFHFIGHSNGTYLLGESLKHVSAMQFERVYLAGSVLPAEYNWRDRFDLDQIKLLRNDRSCWDWPVGILCSGLRGLCMKDIGTGGFDGFQFDDQRIEEVYYYQGGHGSPLAPTNHSNILSFILAGNRAHPPGLLQLDKVSARFRWFSHMAPYLAPILLAIALVISAAWGWWIAKDFAWSSLVFWLKLGISLAIVYFAYALAKTG